jgi:hypothetical protein
MSISKTFSLYNNENWKEELIEVESWAWLGSGEDTNIPHIEHIHFNGKKAEAMRECLKYSPRL